MGVLKPDLQTETAVRLILARCHDTGSDPVRALNERGLLNYEDVRRQAVRDAMNQVADALDNMTVAQFGRYAGRSPADMKREIAAHIRAIYREE